MDLTFYYTEEEEEEELDEDGIDFIRIKNLMKMESTLYVQRT